MYHLRESAGPQIFDLVLKCLLPILARILIGRIQLQRFVKLRQRFGAMAIAQQQRATDGESVRKALFCYSFLGIGCDELPEILDGFIDSSRLGQSRGQVESGTGVIRALTQRELKF